MTRFFFFFFPTGLLIVCNTDREARHFFSCLYYLNHQQTRRNDCFFYLLIEVSHGDIRCIAEREGLECGLGLGLFCMCMCLSYVPACLLAWGNSRVGVWFSFVEFMTVKQIRAWAPQQRT